MEENMKSFDYFKTLIDADVIGDIELDENYQELKLTIGKDVAIEAVEKTIGLAVKEYWLKSLSGYELLSILKSGDIVILIKSDIEYNFLNKGVAHYIFDLKSQNNIIKKSVSTCYFNPLLPNKSDLDGFSIEESDTEIIYTKL